MGSLLIQKKINSDHQDCAHSNYLENSAKYRWQATSNERNQRMGSKCWSLKFSSVQSRLKTTEEMEPGFGAVHTWVKTSLSLKNLIYIMAIIYTSQRLRLYIKLLVNVNLLLQDSLLKSSLLSMTSANSIINSYLPFLPDCWIEHLHWRSLEMLTFSVFWW